MVGPNGLEPSTSCVSGKRSNQLSYGPIPAGAIFPTKQLGPKILIACKAPKALRCQPTTHTKEKDLEHTEDCLPASFTWNAGKDHR